MSIKQSVTRFVTFSLLPKILKLFCKTLRVTVRNAEDCKSNRSAPKRFVFAFWHGTMFYPWYHLRGNNMLALTSQSKDGAILANLLGKWGYVTARGSSSKGGHDALDTMVAFAADTGSVAITPDGPRGPRFSMKAGAVITAKKSRVMLVLIGVFYSRKIVLRNWDQFEIPYPFSRVTLRYSNPIYVDPNLSYDKTSTVIAACEAELNRVQEEAANG